MRQPSGGSPARRAAMRDRRLRSTASSTIRSRAKARVLDAVYVRRSSITTPWGWAPTVDRMNPRRRSRAAPRRPSAPSIDHAAPAGAAASADATDAAHRQSTKRSVDRRGRSPGFMAAGGRGFPAQPGRQARLELRQPLAHGRRPGRCRRFGAAVRLPVGVRLCERAQPDAPGSRSAAIRVAHPGATPFDPPGRLADVASRNADRGRHRPPPRRLRGVVHLDLAGRSTAARRGRRHDRS